MLRRLSVVLLAGLALTFGLTTAASAAPPVSNTVNHEKNLVETFVDVVPSCEPGSPPYTITTTSNLVEKETVFADGQVHATFTQTGKVSAVPLTDPTLPSYTGRFTVWGNFNQNKTTANSTFTFSVTLFGSDGSMVTNHSIEHANQLPDGTVHEFFHCH